MKILASFLLTSALAFSLEAAESATLGTRAFVNASHVAGPRDGKSWTSAFASVQDALATGASEVWVAKGTYRPGTDRQATFQLRRGGALFGGFAGHETQRDQRDWQRNPTTLDGNGAYHVVTGADEAVLDGFTITGGNGLGGSGGPPGGPGGGSGPGKAGGKNGPSGKKGGPGGPPTGGGGSAIHSSPQAILGGANTGSGAGLLNFKAAPTVRNCIFENNQAGKGGAVYNMTSTGFPQRPDENTKTPIFINCIFRQNTAQGRGGAVSNDLGTSPVFLNCVFDRNSTPQKGGGMYNDFGCSPVLINCLFTGNFAESAGGMGNDGASSPVLLHCTFTKNHAQDYGAPLYQGTGPSNNPVLIACVVTDNTCDWESPGIYNWHDNTPLIKDAHRADAGQRPGLFTEAQLPQLLKDLKAYQVRAARATAQKVTEKIPSSARVVYVDSAAATGGDGQSWATAHASLQVAIDDAGKDGAEVRVTAGTYRLGAERAAAFVLWAGVRVLGGFRGGGRDPAKTPTVLDGNHAYHVVIGANGATLDGLTITGGRADGDGYDGKGGGLINYRRAPQDRPGTPVVTGFTMTLNRCTFAGNYARDGGAVYSYDRAKCVFTACVFSGNRAENGGAVLDRVGVESVFTHCEFTDNSAQWRGGAAYFDYGARPQMTGCVFRRNTTGGHGGAIFSASRASQLENTSVALTACRFEGNTAKGNGGAANFHDSSIAAVEDCAFDANVAGVNGHAIALTGNSSWQPGSRAMSGPEIFQAPTRARPAAPAR